jgi:hypothetical protein
VVRTLGASSTASELPAVAVMTRCATAVGPGASLVSQQQVEAARPTQVGSPGGGSAVSRVYAEGPQ